MTVPHSPQARPNKKTVAFIVKLVASLVSTGLIITVGLLLVALNFTEVSAGFITSITATRTETPAQKLVELKQIMDQANLAGDRTATIDALVKMRPLAPDDEQINDQLAQLYYEQGLDWRNANRLGTAQQSFEWALSVKPEYVAAEQERQLIEWYQRGIDLYQQANWAEAAAIFEQIYQQNPTYLYVDEILYSAYYNLGIIQEGADELVPALESYQKAIRILPDASEAKLKVEEVTLKLNPPTPDPTPEPVVEKRIVVDISDQRTYLYENDELVNEFIVSTGEPGQDTAIGEFEIQSKIPMAYASTWNLDMPLWLGIYYSGPLENGFHALPTVRDTGLRMWDGYLGQRVSYGCIVLGMEDAETLYNWAEMGTPVSIVL
jgi:tetratricopeptide (TPR) repeat protein